MLLVGLIETPVDGGVLLRFPELEGIAGFQHAISTKPWNLAPQQGPDRERAVERRRRICEALGLPFENLISARQIHSGHVIPVTASDRGAGRDGPMTAIPNVDGMVCNLPDTPVLQFSADCALILVVDPMRRAFGTCHASWRGTMAEIVRELVRQICRQYGSRPSDLLAAIGPCAGVEDFEVQDDVYRIAQARFDDPSDWFQLRDGRRYFDMRQSNHDQLVSAGVSAERILVADCSTMSDGRFYSHRRDGADTGRFGLVVGFK